MNLSGEIAPLIWWLIKMIERCIFYKNWELNRLLLIQKKSKKNKAWRKKAKMIESIDNFFYRNYSSTDTFLQVKFWDKDHHIGHFEQLRWLFHSFEKKFTGLFNRNLNEMFQIFLFWTFRKQTLLKIHNELSKSAHIIWAIWAHIIWLI